MEDWQDEVATRFEEHERIHELLHERLTRVAATHDQQHAALEAGRRERQAIADALLKERDTAQDRERELLAAAHRREHDIQETAITKAESSVDVRLQGMNEIRQIMNDQALTFVRKEMLNAAVDRITSLERSAETETARQKGQGATIAAVVGVVAFAGTALGLLLIVLNLVKAP